MTLHLKSREYPFRPRLLFSCFIGVGVGFPTVYYFRRGQCDVRVIVVRRSASKELEGRRERLEVRGERLGGDNYKNVRGLRCPYFSEEDVPLGNLILAIYL